MEIWPAIDLLGGRCVRLQQGDYSRGTTFSDHPARMAECWFAEGARRLHCVDLDAAKGGTIVNEPSIRDIVRAASGRPIQLGGGVRSEAVILRLLDLGVARLVVGTAALKNPDWFARMCEKYPQKLVLGVDARNGMVATDGWLETSQTPAVTLIGEIARRTSDCSAIVYTDIARDGMLKGPNFQGLEEVRAASPMPVIASGGVSSLDDVRELAHRQTHAAILGRAIYEGLIDLKEVFSWSFIS
ncbi:MAG: 1-(5-phosphoribosyl)-5-[(5-phosphoribosylamino)methylideneamino]imidazole-4-carboxamide isomerase [Planctomycetota bacterium]